MAVGDPALHHGGHAGHESTYGARVPGGRRGVLGAGARCRPGHRRRPGRRSRRGLHRAARRAGGACRRRRPARAGPGGHGRAAGGQRADRAGRYRPAGHERPQRLPWSGCDADRARRRARAPGPGPGHGRQSVRPPAAARHRPRGCPDAPGRAHPGRALGCPAGRRLRRFGRVTPVGRSRAGVRVAELYQVQVPYGGLPQPTTALALRDDAWEQQLAADLVEADRYLNDLAGTLDGPDGAAVLAASPVVYRVSQLVTGAVTGAVTGSARVEQALGVALAQAAHRGGRDVQARLAAVQAARGSTGSWGVVAAIVDAPATDVGALLDRLRRPAPAAAPAPGGTAATAQALGTVLGLPGAAARAPGASTTGAVAAPALTLTGSDAQPQRPSPVAPGRPGSGRPSSGASNPAPSGPTNPSPASPAPGSPAPASPAPAPAPGVVQTVVDTVLGLVPQPPAPTTGRQVSARTGAARRLASR